MKKEPKIFVIIVTYKGMRWYDKCFSSLRESTIPLQTVVIDNTPGDEDAEYIKTHYPEVHLIKTKENLGFGRANNFGMRYALDNRCDYVFLLNQDTWLIQKEAIAELVALADAHSEYGIVSPMHLTAKQDKLFMMIGVGQDNMRLISDLYTQHLDTIYDTNYVNAAAWLLPRKTLMEIGGFTPIFQQYGEDDDYINRVLYHGYKIGVCPSAKIVHDHQDSFSALVHKKSQDSHTLYAEWLNLKQSFSVQKYYRLYIRRWLKSIILRDSNLHVYYSKAITLLNRHKKEIKDMRYQNMQKQASWL